MPTTLTTPSGHESPVLQVLLNRMNSGFESIEKRFDKFDDRLNNHADRIARIEAGGCSRYEEHLELLMGSGPRSRWHRAKKFALPAGLGAVAATFVFELVKKFFGS